ncbi:pseudouridine synthase [Advenella sp. RU8]|uniref:pseudouridine synthase n=1 Tax=Advenella sp. RU8 TaxID=3399575 RepID=UPI003AAF6C6F
MSQSFPLPVRDGIVPSRLYLPREQQWPDLLSFLLVKFPHMPPAVLQERLARGDMVDATGVPMRLDSPFIADSWLWYYREVPAEVNVPFDVEVLYQDEYLVVADKPHFLASIPGGRYLQETALIRLRKQLNNFELSPIHRLDRDTAGLLLFCASKHHRGAYQTLFQTREVHKTYEAVAPYKASLVFPLIRESHIRKSAQYFTMEESDGLPNSRTRISLLTHKGQLGHYLLEPLTGKKHQLRVHMNGLGISICNDEFYPALLPAREEDRFDKPLQLLARSIGFTDPVTGQERFFESRRELEMCGLARSRVDNA